MKNIMSKLKKVFWGMDWFDACIAAVVGGLFVYLGQNAHWSISMIAIIAFSLIIGWLDGDDNAK